MSCWLSSSQLAASVAPCTALGRCQTHTTHVPATLAHANEQALHLYFHRGPETHATYVQPVHPLTPPCDPLQCKLHRLCTHSHHRATRCSVSTQHRLLVLAGLQLQSLHAHSDACMHACMQHFVQRQCITAEQDGTTHQRGYAGKGRKACHCTTHNIP